MEPNQIQPPTPEPTPTATPSPVPTPLPVLERAAGTPSMSAQDDSLRIKKRRRPVLAWVAGGLIALAILLLAAGAGAYMWYKGQLQSPDASSKQTARVTVPEGSTAAQIAQQLHSEGLIKNATVFELYYRLNGEKSLQAGVYVVEKGMDVPTLIDKLGSGQKDEFQLTFKPGESLLDVRKTLIEAGYEEQDVAAAFTKVYSDYPMMSARPENSDIEGFVFPDTYNFGTDYTAENVLTRPMQYMQTYIDEQGLEEAFAAKGLTLYEGITLASIIQKEVNNKTDMSHVSQVFHSRLKIDMPLGSDPTFVYPAKKQGVQPDPGLDSPYNTYKIKGLPPGPIANPGKEALYAAANPRTDTQDLFFVAGDDGTTYFSKTNAEHEALTQEHCQQRCRLDIF